MRDEEEEVVPLERITVVAFTGHRPNKLGGAVREVEKRLARAIDCAISQGARKFISGGALGVDQMAARIVISHKKAVPGLTLVIARPFPSQDVKWLESSRKAYRAILREADEVVDVCPDPYAAWKMQRRNEWMVDHADLLIAVWDGSPGGTANTVRYARSKGLPIWRIDPRDGERDTHVKGWCVWK